jgi:hypothetical protein
MSWARSIPLVTSRSSMAATIIVPRRAGSCTRNQRPLSRSGAPRGVIESIRRPSWHGKSRRRTMSWGALDSSVAF